ncbi:MAG: ABC transporter ATP-binding protein [Rhodospirillaceae bacterium]|jgi:branched-chain amino acid transport system ATP-binding protein|nr:ABC transporter ATP-binding protein [Rhodospirillaceae bacterium]MBT5243831.1 ABC transporter ATP-binding protein [Rhodospirillaceae bacterium]MBT5562880.1 ABC transporter ATP-binding protein [Rhodospirillaceae bacterium]MBT6241279.1 ABC transporter ATP-binding protein [Rhodospirillaceae bacterium]MBT7137127.1 ABC transporter ATP-binding protein [Rhodospirillaceae bacterium]
MSQPLLSTRALTKSFGGLVAVDDVSIDFEVAKVHAIIGPNGAGKTTLINLLSGDLPPTGGAITFKEHDLTPKKAFAISQLGIGRSYQKTNIFPDFTCLQNCWLGAQSRMSTSMRFFKAAKTYNEVRARAERALDLCGLTERIDTVASAMSYGEQRQLEIGMMLATEPELLLLDEPLAGMGTDESRQVVALIKRLAEEHTVILIEHDMDAVFAVADVLTVMVNGKVLATGTPSEIRANSQVQDAYLGTGEEEAP